jgi:hypothetical protein
MTKNFRRRHAPLTLLAALLITVLGAGNLTGAIRKADNVALENIVDASKVAVATLDQIGHPIREADRKLLEEAWTQTGDVASDRIQEVMDRYAWFDLRVNEEAWLKVETATTNLEDRPLVKGEWTPFLIKVHNESASDAPIGIRARQALHEDELAEAEKGGAGLSDGDAWYRWLAVKIYANAEALKPVHGTKVHYLVVGIFSRDAGMRSAELEFHLQGGPVTEGHFTSKRVLFEVKPPTQG